MTKSKQNLVEAQKFVKDVLAKNFKQKVDAESLRTAAEKILEAVPTSSANSTKRAA